MKIVAIGTRGFPGVQGGVESHCEKLYPKLSKLGCDITVFTRKPYVDPGLKNYNGVELIPLDCPKNKILEAIVHTFKGIFQARKLKPDILHIHAIGPAILVPLAKILGFKVVMTHHGPDYRRRKWGRFAKFVLRVGERLSSSFADEVIAISQMVAQDLKSKYNRDSHVIPNGVDVHEPLKSDEVLKKYDLKKGRYILAVGRFVPEKGFINLIDSFLLAQLKNMKLVIVGRADHESKYSRDLEKRAKISNDVVLTGYLNGIGLKELYSHAGLFVLPSTYEGLPITLLEAMGYGLLCLASDIPANRYIGLPYDNYFSPENLEELIQKLREFSQKNLSEEEKHKQIEMLKKNYSWDEIAKKTLEVYEKVTSTVDYDE
ncbi:MAG TPA: glycosyltransferase family 4 protein [Candidatus Omnitrophota bacterium]|nr:glycosyltransferase family 4 protein [Candidatus Omnitrophota bacterium]